MNSSELPFKVDDILIFPMCRHSVEVVQNVQRFLSFLSVWFQQLNRRTKVGIGIIHLNPEVGNWPYLLLWHECQCKASDTVGGIGLSWQQQAQCVVQSCQNLRIYLGNILDYLDIFFPGLCVQIQDSMCDYVCTRSTTTCMSCIPL